ncbi:MAG: PIN domain-containing protein [Candidatus Sungbacteria bacterium]|nr:PIN domain-containing protein [Candidatus Sungbacteria bacterium]
MPKVFLDANIFFAAVRSSTGGSYFIMELAKQGHIRIVTVAYALVEAERNIEEKIGEGALHAHYENLLAARPIIQSVVKIPFIFASKLATVMPEKDIPILAGALVSGAEALITLDRKHFLENEKLLKIGIPIPIITPGDFLQKRFS